MNKKLRVIESAKDRKVRLANEKKLSDLRLFVSSENSDLYSKSKELFIFSEEIRRLSVFDLALQIVNGIAEVGENNTDYLVGPTPDASKYLTKIITLKEEIISLTNGSNNVDLRTKEKVSKVWSEAKATLDKFEILLRAMFDSVEALLNSLLLNTEIISSYSESLEICYQHNLLTKSQFNVFKMLGHIRNLFVHNSTTFVLLKRIDVEHLYLFKACILEARTAIIKSAIRNKTRMFAFGAYIQAKNKIKNGKILTKNEIDVCHVWYSRMVIDDLLNKVTHIKELYCKDELENDYIKN